MVTEKPKRGNQNVAGMNVPPAVKAGGNYRWVIVALLFFASTINYIDRQVLGILAPFLEKEIGWNEV